VDALRRLSGVYRSQGDQWRTHSFSKASQVHPAQGVAQSFVLLTLSHSTMKMTDNRLSNRTHFLFLVVVKQVLLRYIDWVMDGMADPLTLRSFVVLARRVLVTRHR
jgi:hypothetical protein